MKKRTLNSAGKKPHAANPLKTMRPGDRPRWNAESRELWLGDILVKHFKQPAVDQVRILTTFEEEGWPPYIDDPLPPKRGRGGKQRLHKTIEHLNRARRRSVMCFFGDGTGTRVGWRLNLEG